ncbi:phasin family protein [Hymenobacter sp. HD11105]|jgi:polyhydroxyalkanoate synthesis regulator phasin
MEDLFKKFINAGVGFVSLTNDRVQATIDKLVKESKLSEKEGQKIMDDLKKNTDTKRKELESQITGIANRLMKGVGVATNADVEELKRSVRGTKSSTASSTGATAGGSKSGSKAASSTTSKAAGATKKAADKVSSTAGTAQKSAAAKAGAAKPAAKPAAKKEAPKPADNGDNASSAS